MSFILDALKKVERDKRRAASGEPFESSAVSGTGLGGRRQWVSMAGVALLSAALTAAAVSLFDRRGRDEREDASTAHAATGVEAPEAVARAQMEPGGRVAVSPELASVEDSDSNQDAEHARSEAVEPEPSARARIETENVEPEPASPPVGPSDSEPRAQDPSAEGEPVSRPEVSPPPESFEVTPSSESSSAEPVQPFHLVGRERALDDTMDIRQSPSDGAEGETGESSGPPPAGLPELVLQGTSVIGGSPVAVISGQRVFEGDRIEGARVVRIGEREVELELDGQHFTLRL